MTAHFNHTIVAAVDPTELAEFYSDVLEADELPSWGPFINIGIGGGVILQFATPPMEFSPQHYGYLLDDDHFDRAYAKITTQELEHWADPHRTRPGEINHGHGGRGVYLLDPSGHLLELITRPYL